MGAGGKPFGSNPLSRLYNEAHLPQDIRRSLSLILLGNLFGNLHGIICGGGTTAMIGLANQLQAGDFAFGLLNGIPQAAALLQMIGPKQLRVGIALGSRKILGHQQRLAGFQHILRDDPNCRILDIAETRDDDFAAYDAILRMMQAHPDLNSLFLLSSGGAYGAGRALKSLERNDMTIVAFDTTPPIIELMRRRIIRAALYQHPKQQGQRAMLLAYDYLINGIEPEHEQYIIKNEIRILQNL